MNGTHVCSFSGCGRRVRARGLCASHYERQRMGRPLVPLQEIAPRGATLRQVLDLHSDKSGECWLWTGCLGGTSGYGDLRDPRSGRTVRAHRAAYEMEHGPIPEGYEVDHICHVRTCVRPDHLQLVTRKQNAENLRGARADSKSGVRGVFWQDGAWKVVVSHHGKRYYGGRFPKLEDAETAAKSLRNRLFTNNLADRI